MYSGETYGPNETRLLCEAEWSDLASSVILALALGVMDAKFSPLLERGPFPFPLPETFTLTGDF